MDIKQIVADGAAGSQGRAPGLYDEQLQRQQQERWLFCAVVRDARPDRGAEPSAVSRRRKALHF